MHILKRTFYTRPPEVVAPELLGKLVVREYHSTKHQGTKLVGRIVETEAYSYPHDPASHAYQGKTNRTEALFGEPGHAYIYFVYGNHYALNVVAHLGGDSALGNLKSKTNEELPSAGGVLIRALEPVDGIEVMEKLRKNKTSKNLGSKLKLVDLTSGPGKLAQALAIDKELYGTDLTKKGALYLVDDGYTPEKIIATPRIGISQAKDMKWRFLIAGNKFLSQ